MELKLLMSSKSFACALLLIVPYGIEIVKGKIATRVVLAFNRTLWN